MNEVDRPSDHAADEPVSPPFFFFSEMAAEVVGIMVSIPKEAGYDSRARSQASAHQKEVVGRYLRAWTNLSPHPVRPLSLILSSHIRS